MTVEPQAAFLTEYAEVLGAFWNRVKGHLLEWRSGYQWPPGASPAESTETRTRLERRIRAELDGRGCLSKGTFDAVIRWGFGTDSGCSDQEVRQATGLAFGHIRANRPAEAAMELLKLPRIGISRASKVLALSDQQEFGIYDSRSGHGLSDLALSGRRIIAIPPGRVIRGDSRTSDGYCRAFAEYTWVLRYFRDRACEDPSLRSAFSRAADLELAFFVRSRSGLLETTTRRPGAPEHLQRIADQDEENTFWTLGQDASLRNSGLFVTTQR